MKKGKLLSLLMLLISASLFTQNNFHNTHNIDPYNPEFVKGEVLVKFKDEVETAVKSGIATTGVSSIDKLLEPYSIASVEKVFKETREERQKKALRTYKDFNGKEKEAPAMFNIYKLKFDTIWSVKQMAKELEKDPNIDFAEPNYLTYTTEVIHGGNSASNPPEIIPLPDNKGSRNTIPNDPLFSQQTYLNAINAPAAWDSVTGDTTQIIAIIDTGVDWDHPDLDDNIWTNRDEIPDNAIDDDGNGYVDDVRGWDFINDDNDPNDDNSHGTHVAGIAAAEGNNGIGICGVAWNARIMPVKMFQSTGTGNSSDLASAIEYASDNGATVINYSGGSYGESLIVKTAIENAYAGTGSGDGSIIVAAAGNDGYKIDPPFPPFPIYAPMFPACYSFVIGVEASNNSGTLADFSNIDESGPISYLNSYGHNYEMRSPGISIFSCKQNGDYWQKSGTSMACPEVAGTVALMRQYIPAQSGEEIFSKLIHGKSSKMLDVYNSVTIDLVPDLYYISYTIIDTLPGCDNDGVADAGETIELWTTIKNAGGQADSVWGSISFPEFEDTTTLIFQDSTSLIGSMSAFSTLTGELDPFRIKVDSNIANNRQIQVQIDLFNKQQYYSSSTFVLTIQNGEEIGGYYDQNLYLTAGKEYIGVQSIVIGSDDTLFIDPGVTILMEDGKGINVQGTLIAEGNKDSIITITASNQYWSNLLFNKGYIYYAIIEKLNGNYSIKGSSQTLMSNCVLRYMNPYNYWLSYEMAGRIIKSSIYNNNSSSYGAYLINQLKLEHCNLVNNLATNKNSPNYPSNGTTQFIGCNIFNNKPYNLQATYGSSSVTTFDDSTYFGYNNEDDIESNYYDYFNNTDLGIINISNFSTSPDSHAPGIVWSILINDININKLENQYNSTGGLGIVGAETLKFDVYFNRAMDTAYTPLLTFGVREPYTQQIVSDSASWSADSTIFTAYKTIDMTTGDGIQRVRVYGARDDENFEIPIEDTRFEFVIQAAGAASMNFVATPGIGKVDLEWPPSNTSDALGYNLYRFYNLTDSTYSDTAMINTELILDTVYTDYNVIPDTTYHYLYKTLGTDMTETDYSKKVVATPFNAATGDANGDLEVDVLDITTVVAYMLNQNPSPFLFDAADVNYDDEINVLDIIGLVGLINGKKSISTLPLPDVSKNIAYYSFNGNNIAIESNGEVMGLQFRIKDTRIKKKDGVGNLDKIRIFSLLEGFEFSYTVFDNEIVGVLYSMSGYQLPEGISDIFRAEGADINEIVFSEIFGGNIYGEYVPVIKKNSPQEGFITDLSVTTTPNPTHGDTELIFNLPESGTFSFDIYSISGEKISGIKPLYKSKGSFNYLWKGTTINGKAAESGIYILSAKLKSINGNNYSNEVKIVMVR